MPVSFTVRAVLFDMDGTLVDSTPAVDRAWSTWERRWDVTLGVRPSALGRPAREIVADRVPADRAEAAFRDIEAEATRAHFARLREGRKDTAETGALHLDVVRDLKRVNAHLVEAAAYPVLRNGGELLPSRLRAEPPRASRPTWFSWPSAVCPTPRGWASTTYSISRPIAEPSPKCSEKVSAR